MKKLVRSIFLCFVTLLISGGFTLVTGASNIASAHAITHSSSITTVPIDAHYLALGDSVAFGYQPNGDFVHGYANDLFIDLQKKGAVGLTDFGCPGETSNTFIYGGCPFAPSGAPSQLTEMVDYLEANPGTVSPITLQIGANDVLPAFNIQTCTVNDAQFTKSLSTLDDNIGIIIDFLKALEGSNLDLLLMNYYDPFANLCPNTVSYIETLNQHLANDVAGYGQIVDDFTAFGGATVPNPNICNYTWMCSSYEDIHPTIWGYLAMAAAIEETMNY